MCGCGQWSLRPGPQGRSERADGAARALLSALPSGTSVTWEESRDWPHTCRLCSTRWAAPAALRSWFVLCKRQLWVCRALGSPVGAHQQALCTWPRLEPVTTGPSTGQCPWADGGSSPQAYTAPQPQATTCGARGAPLRLDTSAPFSLVLRGAHPLGLFPAQSAGGNTPQTLTCGKFREKIPYFVPASHTLFCRLSASVLESVAASPLLLSESSQSSCPPAGLFQLFHNSLHFMNW